MPFSLINGCGKGRVGVERGGENKGIFGDWHSLASCHNVSHLTLSQQRERTLRDNEKPAVWF